MSIQQWLRYADIGSFKQFILQSPKRAKKLAIRDIPKLFDEYLRCISNYNFETVKAKKLNSPIYLVYNDQPIPSIGNITYSLMLNLISILSVTNDKTLWKYIENFTPNMNHKSKEFVNHMITCCRNYYSDFLETEISFKVPNKEDMDILRQISIQLNQIEYTPENIQESIYAIIQGRSMPIKHYFQSLYQIFFGNKSGPRFGNFFQFYGLVETQKLIKSKIDIGDQS